VDAILEFADIGEFISQPVKAYSSGMFARLAFSVAINAEPDVLIVDEALSVGDVFFVQKCMRFLREFMKERTVLFVSHDTAAVLNLCQKAILLEGGIVSAQGEPKDITERYIEKLYESQQGESVKQDENNSSNADNPDTVEKSPRDMRLDYIIRQHCAMILNCFHLLSMAQVLGKAGLI
jgi:lipopolysaccharide transport system ATP-binding protein